MRFKQINGEIIIVHQYSSIFYAYSPLVALAVA